MTINGRLKGALPEQPYRHCFLTISGAHLYGFPSQDSDYDLRGAHVLPVREVVGLDPGRETIEVSAVREGLEVDLVTHDVKKFFWLLLKKNGYALEQLYSPLVVVTTQEHQELKEIGKGTITRHHYHHYVAFAQDGWRLLCKDRQVKRVLYLFRVLLTGIHLMQTGEVEANLLRLNEEFRLPYISDLVARKIAGAERSALEESEISLYEGQYHSLCRSLKDAAEASALPEKSSARPALNDLLIRMRLSFSVGDDVGATR